VNAENIKVAVIGAAGSYSTLLLEQINVVVGIAVGVATLVYISAKIYYMIKDHSDK